MSDWEVVTRADQLSEGKRLSVIVDDTPALLFQAGGAYYCIEDICPHDGQPLADGPLDGTLITCPRHGAKFDITTGAVRQMPATAPVQVFDVELRDGSLVARPRR